MGTADDRRLEHARVAVQDVLDLLRVDVLPAPDDHVLHPVDEHEVAVAVEVADIAGVQPAVVQRRVRLGRAVEVAAHDVGTAHEDLAGAAGRRLPVVAEHGDVDAGERLADGSGFARSVDRVEGCHAGALGEPVALDERDAVARLEAVDHLRRHGRGAADRESERRHDPARRRPEAQ